MEEETQLRDLAGHLAYHAGVGFAECRDLAIPADVEVVDSMVSDGEGYYFEVTHGAKTYKVTVEAAD